MRNISPGMSHLWAGLRRPRSQTWRARLWRPPTCWFLVCGAEVGLIPGGGDGGRAPLRSRERGKDVSTTTFLFSCLTNPSFRFLVSSRPLPLPPPPSGLSSPQLLLQTWANSREGKTHPPLPLTREGNTPNVQEQGLPSSGQAAS